MKLLQPLVLIATIFAAAASADAATLIYSVNMNGANEAPANGSAGIGSGTVTFDTTNSTMSINVSFSGLSGVATNAHIHAATSVPFSGTAGVATQTPSFPSFPAATSGTYSQTFDMTIPGSWNAAYISANGNTTATAFQALTAAAASGSAYFNIHSQTFTGGEIRGFLIPVPEPGSVSLFAVGAALAGVSRRRSRR